MGDDRRPLCRMDFAFHCCSGTAVYKKELGTGKAVAPCWPGAQPPSPPLAGCTRSVCFTARGPAPAPLWCPHRACACAVHADEDSQAEIKASA